MMRVANPFHFFSRRIMLQLEGRLIFVRGCPPFHSNPPTDNDTTFSLPSANNGGIMNKTAKIVIMFGVITNAEIQNVISN